MAIPHTPPARAQPIPPLQPKSQTPPPLRRSTPLPPLRASVPPPRASVPPPDVRAIVLASVEAAVAPLRERIDDLERCTLEAIVRVAARVSTSSTPSRPPPAIGPQSLQTTPVPSEDRTPLTPTPVPPRSWTVFVKPEWMLPVRSPDESLWDYVVGLGSRRHPAAVAVVAGLLLLILVAFFEALRSGR